MIVKVIIDVFIPKLLIITCKLCIIQFTGDNRDSDEIAAYGTGSQV